MQRHAGEAAVGLGIIALGAIIFYSTTQIDGAEEGTHDFPTVYAAVIVGGGLIAFGKAVRALLIERAQRATVLTGAAADGVLADGAEVDEEPGWSGPNRFPRLPLVIQVIVAIVAYLLALQYIGQYVVATTLFGAVLLWLLGTKLSARLIVLPVVLAVLLYFVFQTFLSVQLP